MKLFNSNSNQKFDVSSGGNHIGWSNGSEPASTNNKVS